MKMSSKISGGGSEVKRRDKYVFFYLITRPKFFFVLNKSRNDQQVERKNYFGWEVRK